MSGGEPALSPVCAAYLDYQKAGEALIDATKKMLPPMTLIEARIGKHIIQAFVVSACGCWWHQPARICIQNVATGKRRFINAASEYTGVRIIQPSKPADALIKALEEKK